MRIRKACRLLFIVTTLISLFSVGTIIHAQDNSPSPAETLQEAFIDVAKRLEPSVATVFTRQRTRPQRFEFRFPPRNERESEEQNRQRATGTSVIISDDGYILTNHHVVKDTAELQVRLHNKDQFTAKLVGSYPDTDVALLKIDAPYPLIPATLGNSDKVQVGQWAIAIGTPFGLSQTLTVGVVSALRSPFDLPEEIPIRTEFIQTDAAINQGNSGGPLVNLKGEVIGINTAIFSPGGRGSIGIGFSVPINTAKFVIDQLITNGKVVPGWLGVQWDNDLKKRGVGIKEITNRSPASEAGLKAGDVILEYNGMNLRSFSHLQTLVLRTLKGTLVQVKILRNGAEQILAVTVGGWTTEDVQIVNNQVSWRGTILITAPADQQREIRNESRGTLRGGILIADVIPDSPAAIAGVKVNDLIVLVDTPTRTQVPDLVTFADVISNTPTILPIRINVLRNEGMVSLDIPPYPR